MGKLSRLGNALYEGDVSIDFVGRKWLWYAVSGVIVAIALAGLLIKGLNLGIEFEGGVEYTVSGLSADQVNQNTVDKVRNAIASTGIKGTESPIVNTSGSQSIRAQVEPLSATNTENISQLLQKTTGTNAADVKSLAVGPSWGQQVADRAILGLGVFLVLVVIFIWAYFREWKMSVAALVALAHDIVITVGIYALSGFEVTPATVTGLLTILGFSLYDTVVVFDKVRENTKDLRRKKTTYAKAANLAVNQTLVRSINTSIVALLPVAAILYIGVATLGAGSLKDLALSLFVGMASGLYSSVFIATPLAVHLKQGEKAITDAERRERARQRREIDRYADVPVFTEDMPIAEEPGARRGSAHTYADGDELDTEDEERPARAVAAPPRRPETTGAGRVLPEPKREVNESGSSGRNQPTRKPRSQRKK